MHNKLETVTTETNNDFLREKSKPLTIDEINSQEIQEFIDDMIEFASNYKEGKFIAGGLAAVQVGKHYRIFITEILPENTEEDETDSNETDTLKDNGERHFVTFINPEIEILDYTQNVEPESCISVPNRRNKVARYNKIRIKYLDRDGQKQSIKLSDYEARIMQHEYDHLEGILFIDKMIE